MTSLSNEVPTRLFSPAVNIGQTPTSNLSWTPWWKISCLWTFNSGQTKGGWWHTKTLHHPSNPPYCYHQEGTRIHVLWPQGPLDKHRYLLKEDFSELGKGFSMAQHIWIVLMEAAIEASTHVKDGTAQGVGLSREHTSRRHTRQHTCGRN